MSFELRVNTESLGIPVVSCSAAVEQLPATKICLTVAIDELQGVRLVILFFAIWKHLGSHTHHLLSSPGVCVHDVGPPCYAVCSSFYYCFIAGLT